MTVSHKWIWYRDLLQVLLRKELTARYKRSFLGILWSVLSPLAQASVFYLVFKVYMRFNTPHYLVMLLTALFPWQWFVNSVSEGTFTFLSNPTLVKKVAFPRQTIPLVTCLQNMVHFCIALPILLLFMIQDGIYPGLNWLWGVPLLLLLTLGTVYGLSLLLGSINMFLRDIGNLIAVVLQMLFFATPIMYPLSQVPAEYHWCFQVNPVGPLFIAWRSMLMDSTASMTYLILAFGYMFLFLLLGTLVFRRLQSRFAEVM